tara:strand:+ start:354 stop:635 length:282 start_codon:yes stop_codon:yes gene_type:complete
MEEPPESIRINKFPVPPSTNVDDIGSHVSDEDVLLQAGHVVTPATVGLLASAGIFLVRVHQQPMVGVVSVGDELVEVSRVTLNIQSHFNTYPH